MDKSLAEEHVAWMKKFDDCLEKELQKCLNGKEYGLTYEVCQAYGRMVCKAKKPEPLKPPKEYNKKEMLRVADAWKEDMQRAYFNVERLEDRKNWLLQKEMLIAEKKASKIEPTQELLN